MRTNAQNQFNKFYPVRLPRRPVHAPRLFRIDSHNVNRICTLIIMSYHGSHHKVHTQGLCCLRYYRTVMNGQVEYSNEPDDHDFGLLYQVSQRTES